jgi:hypothetical protein
MARQASQTRRARKSRLLVRWGRGLKTTFLDRLTGPATEVKLHTCTASSYADGNESFNEQATDLGCVDVLSGFHALAQQICCNLQCILCLGAANNGRPDHHSSTRSCCGTGADAQGRGREECHAGDGAGAWVAIRRTVLLSTGTGRQQVKEW